MGNYHHSYHQRHRYHHLHHHLIVAIRKEKRESATSHAISHFWVQFSAEDRAITDELQKYEWSPWLLILHCNWATFVIFVVFVYLYFCQRYDFHLQLSHFCSKTLKNSCFAVTIAIKGSENKYVINTYKSVIKLKWDVKKLRIWT